MATQRGEATVSLDRELVITRVLDAPRTLVFKAWTDPKHVAKWWGPQGFTNPVCNLDVRPGGSIRIDMRGPDGTVYPMTGVYQEIVAPERLVFSAAALDESGQPVLEVLTSVGFAEHRGGTKLTLQARVVRVTAAGAAHLEGMEAGWTQSLDRLEEHVAEPGGESSDREIVLARLFDAPRERVWQAWTDPQHVPQWWGPIGFTTTTHHMDVRPGGAWRLVMHGPDGRDYENLITYREVVAPERLTYKHGGDKDCEPVDFQVTVTFAKEGVAGDRTQLTLRMVFPSKSARDFVIREYNAVAGGKQTLERLGEHLNEMRGASRPAASSTDRPFVMARVFNVPRDLMFKVWTQREHLMRWFGPKGVTIPSCALDLRPGGVFHYAMRTPEGTVMWGRWVFRAIVPPEQLVFVVSFSDEAGGVTRAPFNADWPLETLSTVTFAEHAGKGGGTVVNVRWIPINASETERRAFEAGHGSMQQGWTGTLAQLADYLTTA
jgi:uncharacterized protein YndB with AHSA1/START domain